MGILASLPELIQKQVKTTMIIKKYRELKKQIKQERLILRRLIIESKKLKEQLSELGARG